MELLTYGEGSDEVGMAGYLDINFIRFSRDYNEV